MSDIIINGITYPSSRRVAFPGSDGKEVVFDLPTEAEAVLNGTSKRPPQTKAVYSAVQALQQQISSPFNFKGVKATKSALPASGNQVNDTWYVEADKCRYTWTGSAWAQSSLDESVYEDELGAAVRYRGIMDGTTLTPETAEGIGYWYCNRQVTSAALGGSHPSGAFFNLPQGTANEFLQMFILVDGAVFTRYQKSGDFVSDKTRRQTRFVPSKPLQVSRVGALQSVTIPAGTYTLPETSTSAIPLASDQVVTQTSYSVFQFCVFNLSTQEARLVERNATLAPEDMVLFVFYQDKLLNVSVAPEMFPQPAQSRAHTTINDFFAPMFNRTGTPFKIVLGGDSITHGVGGTGFSQNGETIIGNYKRNPNGFCWANLFKAYIESNYNATVTNNGVTGTYSWWWDQNKAALIPSGTDLFILTLGTNNRIKSEGKNGTTHDEQLANYYTQMKSILEYCASINVPVLLCSSIPATQANEDKTQDGAALYPSHVYEFNGVLQRLASEYNTAYFNLYDEIYYYVMDNGLSLSQLLPDGLHPGDTLHRIMFYRYLKGFGLAPSYVPVSLPV